jgi:hypothetical protein
MGLADLTPAEVAEYGERQKTRGRRITRIARDFEEHADNFTTEATQTMKTELTALFNAIQGDQP